MDYIFLLVQDLYIAFRKRHPQASTVIEILFLTLLIALVLAATSAILK